MPPITNFGVWNQLRFLIDHRAIVQEMGINLRIWGREQLKRYQETKQWELSRVELLLMLWVFHHRHRMSGGSCYAYEIDHILQVLAKQTDNLYRSNKRLLNFEILETQSQIVKSQFLFRAMKGLGMVLSTPASTSLFNPFTAEHDMFRKAIRSFVEREIVPHVDEWEAAEIAPLHDLFKKMGQLGFLGLNYPEAYGGADADIWYTVILCEELARAGCGGIPMAITVHTDMCTPALAKYGSHELKEKYLAPAIRGEMVGCVGVTEPDAGSDVARIKTRADRDGDEYVINGSKMYITNGTQADWVCLLARTTAGEDYHGMSLILVPTDTPGFIVSRKLKKLGNHSSDTAVLTFENVRVPVSNCIGDEGMGFYYQMEQFQIERLVGAIGTIAGAELAVRQTIQYTQERRAFNKPLIANQWIQFKLAELLTEIETAKSLNYRCAALLEQLRHHNDGSQNNEIIKLCSMAKLKAGRVARETADTCLQFYGGMGYMEETPISRYFRDSRLISIGGGADEIMMRIIAQMESMNVR